MKQESYESYRHIQMCCWAADILAASTCQHHMFFGSYSDMCFESVLGSSASLFVLRVCGYRSSLVFVCLFGRVLFL
jgi:hypothetical protein